MDFRDQMVFVMGAALLTMVSTAMGNMRADAMPSGTALLTSAREDIQILLAPDVWPRIAEAMAADAGPVAIAPSDAPQDK